MCYGRKESDNKKWHLKDAKLERIKMEKKRIGDQAESFNISENNNLQQQFKLKWPSLLG